MATDLLLANIAKHISLTEEEKRYVSDLMSPARIPKKAFVLQKGQTCRYINFVHSGLLRAFYLGEGGNYWRTTLLGSDDTKCPFSAFLA